MRPPRLSRRLLGWAARRLGAPEMVDDAADLFVEKAEAEGPSAARRWYRRQALAAAGRLVASLPRRALAAPAFLSGLSLDARLAFRMLVRYPGLTVVGGLAMAFAIFVGAATFEFLDQMVDPELPVPEADRLVGLRWWDRAANEAVFPSPAEFRAWREELSTVDDFGAYRSGDATFSVAGEAGEPLDLARMSAVGFRLAGGTPLMGRVLVESDEDPGAPPVVVLGWEVWRGRFAADPYVVGRTVQLDGVPTTVVGVMPRDFGFPVDHGLWTALKSGTPESGSGAEGPPLRTFGRLAPGVTIEEARAELAAVAAASLDRAPREGERLVAEVLPYHESYHRQRVGPLFRALIYQVNVYPALFLILVCGNIALLVFARAASRAREVVVRSALGASRGRILTQLFVETLALGTVATAAGLLATEPALHWILARIEEVGGAFPFWVDGDLSAPTVLYAALLTLLGAAVAGIVPALKATGRGMQAHLKQAGAGAVGLRLGGVWTAVVVTQITATVVFTGAAWVVGRQAVRNATVRPHFPAEQYLGAELRMDPEAARDAPGGEAEVARRFVDAVRELERRIAREPGVRGVALADRLPVQARGFRRLELEGGPAGAGPRVREDHVDLDFFEIFGAPVVAGRGFVPLDLDEGARAVVVNASFAEEVLGGRSAVGRRIRYVGGDGPGEWYEIVGVVRDIVGDRMRSMSGFEDPPRARVFHPLEPSRMASHSLLYVIAHAPGDPGSLAQRLYGLAEEVSPVLRVRPAGTLDLVDGDIALLWRLFAFVVVLVSGVALFLSLAGIYAVMSFTVARRTREIGVRVALGAEPVRVVREVFRTPMTWVGTGIVAGCALMVVLVTGLAEEGLTVRAGSLIVALGVGALGVCALACIPPTLRALRIEPREALGAEE